MLRNYLTTAVRALRRRLVSTAINVGGLTIGLTCCFLIVLFIQHERSFDRFHAQADRIYRVTYRTADGAYANSAGALGPALEAALPAVEQTVRVETHRRPYLQVGGRSFATEAFTLADPAFFEVFDGYELLRGDPASVLQDPRSLVLTERAATRLFGNRNPIGQTVGYGDRFDLTVTGVLAALPPASHLQFEFLAPFALVAELEGDWVLDDFFAYNYFTYALLAPEARPDATEAAATRVLRDRLGDQLAPSYRLDFQPLPDIHLTTSLRYDVPTTRSRASLYVFGVVGGILLLIACLNFTNLATAQSMERAREIGVRKAVGARGPQLVGQFLGEAVLLSTAATGLALGLTAVLLPVFNDFVGSAAGLDTVGPATAALLVGIGLGTGVLAGAYPAFYLSRLAAGRVLRGELTRSVRAARLRRGLVVVQFALAVLLIVVTGAAFQQLQFLQTKHLGFEGEQVVYADAPMRLLHERYGAFRERALASPHVVSVAQGQGLPGRTLTNMGYLWPGRTADEEQGTNFWTIAAGPGYLETLGLSLLAGRGFSRPADTLDTYVLNRTAAEAVGWSPQEAVGQSFRAFDRPAGTVIGVVADFHFQSLHQPIEPVVLTWKPTWMWLIAARLAPGDIAAGLDHLETQWEQFAPGHVFDYTFLDADYGRLYRTERRMSQLFGFFAVLAVLLAGFGLFGLSALAAERRTKEIGVRKALGATTRQIVAMVSREFLRLVGLAFLVAAPVAYVAAEQWLAAFAYRIDLGVGLFAAAGGLVSVIALLTVSYHALRAARTEPVRALRSE
jgi:putative ABC transport system permease protein